MWPSCYYLVYLERRPKKSEVVFHRVKAYFANNHLYGIFMRVLVRACFYRFLRFSWIVVLISFLGTLMWNFYSLNELLSLTCLWECWYNHHFYHFARWQVMIGCQQAFSFNKWGPLLIISNCHLLCKQVVKMVVKVIVQVAPSIVLWLQG